MIQVRYQDRYQVLDQDLDKVLDQALIQVVANIINRKIGILRRIRVNKGGNKEVEVIVDSKNNI